MVQDVKGWTGLDNFPLPHDGQTWVMAGDQRKIMGDKQHAEMEPFLKIKHQVQDVFLDERIERRGGASSARRKFREFPRRAIAIITRWRWRRRVGEGKR